MISYLFAMLLAIPKQHAVQIIESETVTCFTYQEVDQFYVKQQTFKETFDSVTIKRSGKQVTIVWSSGSRPVEENEVCQIKENWVWKTK